MKQVLAQEYFEKGLYKFEENKLQEAKEALQKSIGLEDTLIEAHNLLGLVYYKIGDIGSAKVCWKYSLSVQQKGNRAKAYMVQVESVAVQNYEAHYNKALEAMEIGKYKEAQKLLMSQEVRGMQTINAMNLLGLSLYGQKKERKAIKVWQQVLESDKQNSKALQYIMKVELLSPKERFLGLIGR